MKREFKKVFNQIERKEKEITLDTDKVVSESLEMVKYLNNILLDLKEIVIEKGFKNEKDEINFFRNIKPKVQGKLFYYNKIYRIETLRPVSCDEGDLCKKYFLEEEKRMRKKYKHFLKSSDFHRYYHSGSEEHDTKYFTRYQISFDEGLDNHAFELDPNFSTYYDYMVARIISKELFYEYLLFRTSENQESIAGEYSAAMEWTANKSALVELIYALYACGCLTSGRVSINKIALIFQSLFKVQLGDVHHAFHQMKTRTNSRTLFLDELKESLEAYMNKKL